MMKPAGPEPGPVGRLLKNGYFDDASGNGLYDADR
jgi:hypothetical protein